ncbi:hypothetical protein ACFLTM_04575 [Candidatus Bipolaricaulota bacterium]
MTGDVVCIIVGAAFLVLALGGDLELFKRAIAHGPLRAWARIAAAIVGTGLLVVGVMNIQNFRPTPVTTAKLTITSPSDDITSIDEHVKIVVEGEISGTIKDPEGYKIFVLVHPLEATGYWVQKPGVSVQSAWEAIAYLGGTGSYSARDGERFQIVAVVASYELRDQYSDIDDFDLVSEPVTLTVRRP